MMTSSRNDDSWNAEVWYHKNITEGIDRNVLLNISKMPKTMIWAWIKNFIGSDPSLDIASSKGSKYNVQVEWETGEITFEPLSIIAADDPVTCAAYDKENDFLALEGWHRFRSLAKKGKVLARAMKQSKIRQVRRCQTYMFGYLIPRKYMEAM